MQALAEPPFPEELEHVYRWAHELHGRCGVTMGGMVPVVLPLNNREVRAWRTNTGHSPDVLEVQALFTLDAVMRHPEPAREETKVEQKETRAWPKRGERRARP